ncbi:unnamed protein product [Arabidopsis thaliana]|uniref:(thale cress) hypothetical protein n=1 Tax=Arabidopsis thaliana TaxID=3702 RepID=A0A7G2EZ46_ARATH|nr:unnamed protein product [Arabidopsis thaliana]
MAFFYFFRSFTLISNIITTDANEIFIKTVSRSIFFKIFAILVVRPSHRFSSKSRPAPLCSSFWDSDPLTKCFAWLRQERSSALTPEPMKYMTVEESSQNGTTTTDPPPQSEKKSKEGLTLTLILLFFTRNGPGPRSLFSPSKPPYNLSQLRHKLRGISPSILRPSLLDGAFYQKLICVNRASRLSPPVGRDFLEACLRI